MEINLRKLESANWIYFAKWWRDKELIALTSGDFTELYDEDIQKQIAEMAVSIKDNHWLILADDIVVGHVNLNKIDKETAELQIVIGEKDYWGKGIGSESIKQVLLEAQNLGYQKIVTEVRPENQRAINFYSKMDFQDQGHKKYPNNPNLPETILMIKDL